MKFPMLYSRTLLFIHPVYKFASAHPELSIYLQSIPSQQGISFCPRHLPLLSCTFFNFQLNATFSHILPSPTHLSLLPSPWWRRINLRGKADGLG